MRAQIRSTELRTIVVLERQPCWEPELRRQFHDEQVVIQACRTLSDLDQLIANASHSVVVADLTDRPVELLRWLSRRLVSGRSQPVVVVTNPNTTALLWHASEFGATAVVSETCGGHCLARLCRRQWHEFPTDRPSEAAAVRAPIPQEH